MPDAPSWMRRKVKEIDRDLDVVWLEHESKWAVIQKLYNTPSIEEMARRLAPEYFSTFADYGYVKTMAECEGLAYIRAAEDQIVFRLEDDTTGAPMPLDERLLIKLRECAWRFRNFRLQDFIAAGNQIRTKIKDERDRRVEHIWSSIKRDKVFRRQMSDALWNLRPTRSVGGSAPTTAASAA